MEIVLKVYYYQDRPETLFLLIFGNTRRAKVATQWGMKGYTDLKQKL